MASSDKFCLQWNEFQANLKTSYRDVRKTGDYSDVTLVCEDGQKIEAHRVILASSSLFFREVLAGVEHPRPLVYMRRLGHHTLAAIVDFIYHGEAEVAKEQLDAFLDMAGELGVRGMTKPARKEQGKAKMDKLETIDDEETETKEDRIDGKMLEEEIETIEGEIETMLDNIGDKQVMKSEESAEKEEWKCDLCGKVYGTKGSLRTHKYNHTKNDAATSAPIKTEPLPLKNDISEDLDKTVGDNVELEEKIDELCERREGIWTCIQCGKTDKMRFHLRRHVETHLQGFTHTCTSCDKTFTTRATLKAHVLRSHPEEKTVVEKPFNCDICDMPSKSRAAVNMHKQRRHSTVI